MFHAQIPAAIAALLAGVGVYGLIARRSLVLMLISAELILNSAALLLITGELIGPTAQAADGLNNPAAEQLAPVREALLSGQAMTLFIITLAAAEIGLALALVLALFRTKHTSSVDDLRELGEQR